MTSEEFEQLWTTFFDILDTFESFGSHLIKAVWHRSELLYDFILKNKDVYDSDTYVNPLEDFRQWLLVIYERCNSHPNLKIRRYVLKETLKRPFVTTNMREYIFGQYLSLLNTGLLFKDITFYNVFSKNAELVYNFYCRYFEQESQDLAGDFHTFVQGVVKYITHP